MVGLAYRARFASLVTFASLAMCGCGGGGDDPPLSQTEKISGPASVAASAPGCNLTDIESEVLARINAARVSGAVCGSTTYPPVAALKWNQLLLAAADGHAKDMSSLNYFSHTSLDGRTPSDRVTAAGYAFKTTGENIAAGQTSTASVMNGWLGSPGHCANMMNADFVEVGVACAAKASATNTYPTYWTMVLGS